jgi:hypothetical protein
VRVHLAVLVAVCTATASNTQCVLPGNEWPAMGASVVGPSQPGPAPTASTAAAGAPVTHFCAGYKAGTLQGWKDLRGAASNPDGHVPQDVLDGCPTPACGSESYQDGYATGRPAGVEWARRYP